MRDDKQLCRIKETTRLYHRTGIYETQQGINTGSALEKRKLRMQRLGIILENEYGKEKQAL